MLSHYHVEVNPDDENNSHSLILRMVGFNKRVLEAGCSSGHVSKALKARECRVVGVEIDPIAAESAKQWLERIVVGNLEDVEVWDQLDGEFFDVIVFGDVLEHLRDPLAALRKSLQYLQPGGTVVVSVPNIAHADIKIALLNGEFPYADSGLLDRTHVHFFTKETLLDLLREAGLAPVEFCRATAPVFTTEIGVEAGDVDDQVLKAALVEREAETYQFVVKAVRDNDTSALENLSKDLIELNDQLRDATRRNGALQTHYDAQVAEIAELRSELDLLKRLIPRPLRKLGRMLRRS
jgi:2-polyprenyl-3-methyl-5-hydroxy-6-metoxy-1,4-benzoquinol methylase